MQWYVYLVHVFPAMLTYRRFIAAERPPHLKAIAPWEGLGDYYRESICRGGIPDHTFWDALFSNGGGQLSRNRSSPYCVG